MREKRLVGVRRQGCFFRAVLWVVIDVFCLVVYRIQMRSAACRSRSCLYDRETENQMWWYHVMPDSLDPQESTCI